MTCIKDYDGTRHLRPCGTHPNRSSIRSPIPQVLIAYPSTQGPPSADEVSKTMSHLKQIQATFNFFIWIRLWRCVICQGRWVPKDRSGTEIWVGRPINEYNRQWKYHILSKLSNDSSGILMWICHVWLLPDPLNKVTIDPDARSDRWITATRAARGGR